MLPPLTDQTGSVTAEANTSLKGLGHEIEFNFDNKDDSSLEAHFQSSKTSSGFYFDPELYIFVKILNSVS